MEFYICFILLSYNLYLAPDTLFLIPCQILVKANEYVETSSLEECQVNRKPLFRHFFLYYLKMAAVLFSTWF